MGPGLPARNETLRVGPFGLLSSNLSSIIQVIQPRLALRNFSDLLQLDAARLAKAGARSEPNLEELESSPKSEGELIIDLQETDATDRSPGPELLLSPEQTNAGANSYMEATSLSKEIEILEWMSVQEAFRAAYIRLKLTGLYRLSQSDRVVLYILDENIPIRILDVFFSERATVPGRMEVVSRYLHTETYRVPCSMAERLFLKPT